MSEKVSVIVPTKDGKERIEKCLKSIMEQSYDNWEGFVIDDGSTDGTPEMIKKHICDCTHICFVSSSLDHSPSGIFKMLFKK